MSGFDDALQGNGQLFMLAGEPGIGKSRMASELAGYARMRGAQVLWGRCYEEQRVPPYWPWTQALRAYVETEDVPTLTAAMGPGAADIANIIPSVADKIPGLEVPPGLGPEEARFRLFDSITSFLKSASDSEPLLVVLEDLQWAAKPSLLLLEFVAREIADSRVLLVATYRNVDLARRHPLTETLGGLARESQFHQVFLRGLSRDEVGRFIETSTKVMPPTDLVEAIYARTEGNPFFLTEVVHLLEHEHRGSRDPLTEHETLHGESGLPSFQVPAGVREAIGRRLNRLSDGANHALSIASVIGREFDFNLLAQLVEGLSEAALLGSLDEVLVAGLVEEVPRTAGWYQFTHGLVQETLVEEISTTRRVRLHAQIADKMETLYGPEAESYIAELAYHFGEAATVTGPEKPVRYALLAGEQALSAHAYEKALLHFQRALASKENQPMDGGTAALLFGLARAQTAAFQPHHIPEAMANLSKAFEYFVDVGEVDRALEIAEFSPPPLPGLAGVAEILARALELVPADSHRAGHLLSRYGRWIEEDYEASQDASGRALEIAKQRGDVALEMQALSNSAQVDIHHMRWNESLEKSQRVLQLSRKVSDPASEVAARFWSAVTSWNLGELTQLQRHASAALPVAGGLRDRYWSANTYLVNAAAAQLQGDWAAAREYSDRGLAVSSMQPHLLCIRSLLEFETGAFPQGRVYLERLVEAMRLMPPELTLEHTCVSILVPLANRISGSKDLLGLAETAAATVLSSPSAARNLTMLSRCGLALVGAIRGDTTAIEQQYREVATVPGTILAPSTVATDRLLGVIAHALGKSQDAFAHFDRALAFCSRAHSQPELAWTSCDYAEALLQRNNRGDRGRAEGLLADSIAISRPLGMLPLRERAEAMLGLVASQPRPSSNYPDGLTHREIEVLELMALGKSNREIAQELIISPRTAVHHVTSILAKTGASNRTEAAAYAARHGLVSWNDEPGPQHTV